MRVRFEATFTNVLNHTNFAPPALNLGNPSNFGVLQAALPQGSGGNRTGQLALRLDFSLPKTKRLTGYTWIQTGITSYTGNAQLQNRWDSSLSLGAIVHLNRHSSIWIQESLAKS
jgi:hypothetical protein